MPSTSAKQHRLMAMVAHDPAAAKRLGIPQSVGRDFVKADVGRKFKQGGEMKESKAMMKKEVGFMKKAGAPKSMIKHEEAEMAGMKRGGAVKKMAMGGGPLMSKGMTTAKMGKVVAGGKRPHGEHTVQQKGHTRGMEVKMKTGQKPEGGQTRTMKRGGKC